MKLNLERIERISVIIGDQPLKVTTEIINPSQRSVYIKNIRLVEDFQNDS